MTEYTKAVRTLKRWAQEDRVSACNEEKAEDAIAGLRPGYNYLTSDQYGAVIQYIYSDDERKRARAMLSGACKVGSGIELIRVDWLKREHMFSVSELSRMTGIPRKTIANRLARLNLPCQQEGSKKLYDIRMIRDCLDSSPN